MIRMEDPSPCTASGKESVSPEGQAAVWGGWGGGRIRTGQARLCGAAPGTSPPQGGMHGPGDGWRVLVPLQGEQGMESPQ